MLERLCRQMEIPLREQNRIFVSAGYAPVHPENPLDHPSFAPALAAIEQILHGHAPYPALAVDGHWNIVMANAMAQRLTGLASNPALLEPPVNVLRLSLHPEGLAPFIVNLAEWRQHLLHRLKRQIDTTAHAGLIALESELRAYPAPAGGKTGFTSAQAIAIPLKLRVDDEILALISTVTVFGTPVDITLSEVALETFFPADAQTATILRAMDQL